MLKLKIEARKDATEYLEKAGNESDFTIDERPRCTCELCDVLAEFLNSGSQSQLVWPVKKEFRRHVHQIINELELSVTHTTRRQGSPHQLILSKSPELKNWRKKRCGDIGSFWNFGTKFFWSFQRSRVASLRGHRN